jgi:hypothetical protein
LAPENVTPAARQRTFLIIQPDTCPMEEGDGGSAAAFLKALAVALGILALACLLIFLPVVGAFLLVTAAPFAACNYAVKLSGLDSPRGWLWLGIAAGGIISLVESSILLSLFGLFGALDILEPVGLLILLAVLSANMGFGALGARRAYGG